jgi:hypothetical protein
MRRRGFIHHPFVVASLSFLLGALVMFLLAKGIIPSPFSIC